MLVWRAAYTGWGFGVRDFVGYIDPGYAPLYFLKNVVPRMNEIPAMHIELIKTENPPTGAGQMATPLMAPAIGAAIARLAGVRLRHTPFTPERVKAALA